MEDTCPRVVVLSAAPSRVGSLRGAERIWGFQQMGRRRERIVAWSLRFIGQGMGVCNKVVGRPLCSLTEWRRGFICWGMR